MKEDLEGEIWKDIPDYEGIYQISNMGRVKSLKFDKERILKAGINKRAYLNVGLSKNGKTKTFTVHKLVAINFLDHKPCGHKIVVDHIDENPLNNIVENLQIISQRENAKRVQDGRYSSDFKGVFWKKKANKWCSSIIINGKSIYLGSFTDEQKAGKAYQTAIENLEKYNFDEKKIKNYIKKIFNTTNFTSDFKGVCWHKNYKKWFSQIHINGKNVFLGNFTDEQQASKTYQTALANIDKYDGNDKKFRNYIKNLIKI